MTLISWDIDAVSNEALMKELKALGVRKALSYTVDVTDLDRVAETVAKVRTFVVDLFVCALPTHTVVVNNVTCGFS